MNDEQLNELLGRADEATVAPTPAGDLSARVYRAVRRKSMVRGGAMLAAMVVLGGGFMGWLIREQSRPTRVVRPMPVDRRNDTERPPALSIEQLQAEFVRLDGEASAHTMNATMLLRVDEGAARRAVLDELLDRPDVRRELTAGREEAARTLMLRGDGLMKHLPDERERAAESYRRVIELFPDSDQVPVARQRLMQLGV